MAIFRCMYCEQTFDLSLQHSKDGLNFCGKCYSIFLDNLKPKVPKHPMEEYNKDEDDHLHLSKKKKKGNSK